MPDWFWMVVVLAAYVLLTQWILPKLGVPTRRTAASAGSRRNARELEATKPATQKRN